MNSNRAHCEAIDAFCSLTLLRSSQASTSKLPTAQNPKSKSELGTVEQRLQMAEVIMKKLYQRNLELEKQVSEQKESGSSTSVSLCVRSVD